MRNLSVNAWFRHPTHMLRGASANLALLTSPGTPQGPRTWRWCETIEFRFERIPARWGISPDPCAPSHIARIAVIEKHHHLRLVGPT